MKKIFVILLLCSLHSPAGASNSTDEPSTTIDFPLLTTPASAHRCHFLHDVDSTEPPTFPDADKPVKCFIKYRYNTVNECYLTERGAANIIEQEDKHRTPHCDFSFTTNKADVLVTCTCYTSNCNHNLSHFQTVLENNDKLRWEADSIISAPVLNCLVNQARADAGMPPLTPLPEIATTTDFPLLTTPAAAQSCYLENPGILAEPPTFPDSDKPLKCFIKYLYDTSNGCTMVASGAANINEEEENQRTPHCDFSFTTTRTDVLVTCTCYTTDCNHNLSHFQTVLENNDKLRWEADSIISAPVLHCLVNQARADAGMPPLTPLPEIATTTDDFSCLQGELPLQSLVPKMRKKCKAVIGLEQDGTCQVIEFSRADSDKDVGCKLDRKNVTCYCNKLDCTRELIETWKRVRSENSQKTELIECVSRLLDTDTPLSGTSTMAPSTTSLHVDVGEIGSSDYFGWMLGSVAFNVLLVVTILALVTTVIKMKKGVDVNKGKTQTAPNVSTPTVIQIDKPPVANQNTVVPPSSTDNKPTETKEIPTVLPPSNKKAANLEEDLATAVANTHDESMCGYSDSDSTGPDGPTEARMTVGPLERK